MRDRVENAFERWGRFVARHGWAILLATIALSAPLVAQLSKIRFDVSTESLLPAHDPARRSYDRFRALFGTDEIAIIALGTDEVFDLEFLRRLKALHDDLEAEVPYLAEITSLVNARSVRGEGDELIVGDFLEDWPESEAELAALRERALSNPIYVNNLLTADGRATAIILRAESYGHADDGDPAEGWGESPPARRAYLDSKEQEEFVAGFRSVLARHPTDDLTVHVSGIPVMNVDVLGPMRNDMRLFMALALLSIAVLLFVVFRRISGVVYPLVVVFVSILCTLGTMAVLGAPIQAITQILPSFLLAVGVGGTVHVLAIFYRSLDAGCTRQDALAFSLGHSGMPLVFAALTTAGGLASFLAADIAPIAALGKFGPLGVMLTLVFGLVMLPALLAVTPIRGRRGSGSARPSGERAADAAITAPRGRLDRMLVGLGRTGTGRPRTVVAVFAGLSVVAAAGAAQLRFSHNPVEWLPESHPGRRAVVWIDENLGGVFGIEVLVEAPEEGALKDPALLRRLDAMAQTSKDVKHDGISVGLALSLVDIVKEIHQALNENQRSFRAIPEDRNLVSQELLLFESGGMDELEKVADSSYRLGRMTLRVPSVDGLEYPAFLDELEQRFARELGGAAEFQITGNVPLVGRAYLGVVHSLSRTYLLAFAVIAPFLALALGSLRAGAVAVIPNVLPILFTIGLMGWFGFTLDVFTLLIGSIAIGIAVDDTIHFMHNFHRYSGRTSDVESAVTQTLTTTGRALFFTSLLLTVGFLVYVTSTFSSVFRFGLLTAFAIGVAFVADVLLAPALVALFLNPKRAVRADLGREDVAIGLR